MLLLPLLLGPVTARGAAGGDLPAAASDRALLPLDLPLRPERPAPPAGPAPAGAPPSSTAALQPIEDPAGRGLAELFARLRALEGMPGAARPVRILHYGDSHVAADFYTDELRRLLQARFGDGGPGFVMLGPPGGYRHGRVRQGVGEGWSFSQSLPAAGSGPGGRLAGLGGMWARSSFGGDRAWLQTASGDGGDGSRPGRAELFILQRPGGGTFELRVDGRASGRVATRLDGDGPPRMGFTVLELAGEGRRHHLELVPLGDGEVTLAGVVLEGGRGGLVYDTLGVNGARAAGLLQWDFPLWAAQLRRRDPDLVILAYGANEAGDAGEPLSRYREGLDQVLLRLHEAVPRASCLLVGPLDRAAPASEGGWRSLLRVLEIVAVQRQAAQEHGCAFWNAFAAQGGRGAIDARARQKQPEAQGDRVHLTRAGYSRLAQQLAAALLSAYEAANGASARTGAQ